MVAFGLAADLDTFATTGPKMDKINHDVEAVSDRNIQRTHLPDRSASEGEHEWCASMADSEHNRTATETRHRALPLTTLLLLGLWPVISSALIMPNTYIMRTLEFGYPATLTCWHQASVAFMSQFRFSGGTVHSEPKAPKIPTKEYIGLILPIAALYALALVFNSLPYLCLSVAFVQMLKGLGPATTLLAMWSLGLQSVDFATCLNIGLVVAGAVVASVGELRLEVRGVIYQVLGLLSDGFRLGLTRKLLSGDKKVEPLVAMGYMAPPSALMLALIAAASEWPSMSREDVDRLGLGVFLVNGGAAFLLHLVMYSLVSFPDWS
jgi:multidrug transporter EmrE-like cation transporter